MSDLAFHVRQYLPEAQGEELEHRIALLKARDWAAAMRGRTTVLQSFNLAVEAHEAAGAFVFKIDETVERLAFAVKLTRHLVGAAMMAEQLADGEVQI